MRVLILQLWRDESGQDLVEWALIVAFVTVGSAALTTQSGGSISTVWTAANVALQGAAPPSGGAH